MQTTASRKGSFQHRYCKSKHPASHGTGEWALHNSGGDDASCMMEQAVFIYTLSTTLLSSHHPVPKKHFD